MLPLQIVEFIKQLKPLLADGEVVTTVIVSGAMGSRGTVFKSTNHKFHLTDIYASFTKETYQQVC